MAASLFGGPLIDRYDRRRLLLVAQIGQARPSALLLAGALADHTPLARRLPRGRARRRLRGLLAGDPLGDDARAWCRRDRLPSALALNQVMWNTAQIVGPALGGIVVGHARPRVGLRDRRRVLRRPRSPRRSLMRPHPPIIEDPDAEVLGSWQRLMDGFRFLKGRKVLQSTFIVDLIAMIFGMPRALFPVLARTQFRGGPELVGVLFSSVSVGALVAALTSGWVHRVVRQGLAIIVAVVVWGARDCRVRARRRPHRSWPCCASRSPAGPTSCPRCSGRRSCRPRCPTICAAGCRGSTSRSSRAARGSATSRPGSSRRCSARRSRWCPAA